MNNVHVERPGGWGQLRIFLTSLTAAGSVGVCLGFKVFFIYKYIKILFFIF